jgi:hypothetical protein
MPTKDLIADFLSRIESLKQDGVPDFPPLGGRLPWAEASEERKLQNIVWEAMAVWPHDEATVPDLVRLEAVEQNVDYAKLPEAMRTHLEGLRFAPEVSVSAELERISGVHDDGHDHDFPEKQAAIRVPDFRADVLDSLMSRLEAFGDEFERLAHTDEQKELAVSFGDFTAEVHTAIKYMAETTRQYGPATPDVMSPEDQFKLILSGDSSRKYEQHLNEATERALARMQGNEGRER